MTCLTDGNKLTPVTAKRCISTRWLPQDRLTVKKRYVCQRLPGDGQLRECKGAKSSPSKEL